MSEEVALYVARMRSNELRDIQRTVHLITGAGLSASELERWEKYGTFGPMAPAEVKREEKRKR